MNDQPLAGQTAIVTGASSGIGLGVARGLARAGAAVVFTYRSGREAAEKEAASVEAAGGRAAALQADVSKEEEVERLFALSIERFGAVDVVVANAGVQKDAAAEAMSLDDWRTVIDVNLTGCFLCARRAVATFLRQGRREGVSRAAGKLIFMSSVHEVIPWAGRINYAASKGGVMLLMKSLAQEVAEKGIRVNAIAPGAIRTPINKDAWETPEAEAKLLRLIPYGRIGVAEDVAEAATWLASDLSDYVVGTTLFVDGGMTLYPEFRDNG